MNLCQGKKTFPKTTPAGGSQVAVDRVLARMQTKLTARAMKPRAATKISGMKMSRRRSNSDAAASCSSDKS